MPHAGKPLPGEPAKLKADFLGLTTSRDIANLLDVRYDLFTHLIYRSSPALRYAQFSIPKRNGSSRTIMAPNRSLRMLQAKLAYVLSCVYEPRPSAHGFVADRSILTNARYHCRRTFVFNVDLKDFFPSINFGRVRGLFMAKPYGLTAEAATVIAQICCFNNQLPQGAPTSPIVSNMICTRLDFNLQQLAGQHKCRYTRYADDLSFSTYIHAFPEAIGQAVTGNHAQVGAELAQIIQNNGFKVNLNKVWLQRWDSHQEVTGLTVNRRPNVRRRFVRQVRAMLHAWDKYGLTEATREHIELYRSSKHRDPNAPQIDFKRVVSGKIAHITMVRGANDPVTESLRRKFEQLASREERAATPVTSPKAARDVVRAAMWVLECDEQCSQGTAFALKDIGLITCAHVLCDHAKEGQVKAFRPEAITTRYPVEVVRTNEVVDLAILKISADIHTWLEMGLEDGLPDHASIMVGGFPNYREGDTGSVVPGYVVGYRPISSIRRALVSASIVTGASGGPVVDSFGVVVGVAVTGADAMEKVHDTEKHGVIPIEALSHLLGAPVA